jgi:hypothetical protein
MAWYTGVVMSDRLRESTATLLAALLWGFGALAGFVILAVATHEIVHVLVKSGSPDWRAVVVAVITMFGLTIGAILLALTGRGVTVLPRRVHRRRARRSVAARIARENGRSPEHPR